MVHMVPAVFPSSFAVFWENFPNAAKVFSSFYRVARKSQKIKCFRFLTIETWVKFSEIRQIILWNFWKNRLWKKSTFYHWSLFLGLVSKSIFIDSQSKFLFTLKLWSDFQNFLKIGQSRICSVCVSIGSFRWHSSATGFFGSTCHFSDRTHLVHAQHKSPQNVNFLVSFSKFDGSMWERVDKKCMTKRRCSFIRFETIPSKDWKHLVQCN